MGSKNRFGCGAAALTLVAAQLLALLPALSSGKVHQVAWGGSPQITQLAIEVADSINFTNSDTQPHTVTSDAGSCHGCQFCGRIFDSPVIQPGESYVQRFMSNGQFPVMSRSGSLNLLVEVFIPQDGCPEGTEFIGECQEDRFTRNAPCAAFNTNKPGCTDAGCQFHTHAHCGGVEPQHNLQCDPLSSDTAACEAHPNCTWTESTECMPDCTAFKEEASCSIEGCMWYDCVVADCAAVPLVYWQATSCSGSDLSQQLNSCESSATGKACHGHVLENGGVECVKDHWRDGDDYNSNSGGGCDCSSQRAACNADPACATSSENYEQHVQDSLNGNYAACSSESCWSSLAPTDPNSRLLFEKLVNCSVGIGCSGCDRTVGCPNLNALCFDSTDIPGCAEMGQCLHTCGPDNQTCWTVCEDQTSNDEAVDLIYALARCGDYFCEEGRCSDTPDYAPANVDSGASRIKFDFSFFQEHATITQLEAWLAPLSIERSTSSHPHVDEGVFQGGEFGIKVNGDFFAAPKPSGPFHLKTLVSDTGAETSLFVEIFISDDGEVTHCADEEDDCVNECQEKVDPCKQNNDCGSAATALLDHIKNNLGGNYSACGDSCVQSFAPADTTALALYNDALNCYLPCKRRCTSRNTCPNLHSACFDQGDSQCSQLGQCMHTCYEEQNGDEACQGACRQQYPFDAVDLYNSLHFCNIFACQDGECGATAHLNPSDTAPGTTFSVDFSFNQEHVSVNELEGWLTPVGITKADNGVHPTYNKFVFSSSKLGILDDAGNFHPAPAKSGPFFFQDGTPEFVMVDENQQVVYCLGHQDCDEQCKVYETACLSNAGCASAIQSLELFVQSNFGGKFELCDASCFGAHAPTDPSSFEIYSLLIRCHTRECEVICALCQERQLTCLNDNQCAQAATALRNFVDANLQGNYEACNKTCQSLHAPPSSFPLSRSLYFDLAACGFELCSRYCGDGPTCTRTSLTDGDECLGLCYEPYLACNLDPACKTASESTGDAIDRIGNASLCNASFCTDPYVPAQQASADLFSALVDCYFPCLQGLVIKVANATTNQETDVQLSVSVLGAARGSFSLRVVAEDGDVFPASQLGPMTMPELQHTLAQTEFLYHPTGLLVGGDTVTAWLTLHEAAVGVVTNVSVATTTVVVEAVEYPPLVASATQIMVRGEDTPIGQAFEISHKPGDNDDVVVEVTTTAGVLLFEDVEAGVTYVPPTPTTASAQSWLLTGSLERVTAAMKHLQLRAFPDELTTSSNSGGVTLAQQFVTVFVHDVAHDNDVTVASVPVSFDCTGIDPVVPQEARFTNDLSGIVITFDSWVHLDSTSCTDVLAPATLAQSGAGPACSVHTVREVLVTLGVNATLLPGDTITFLANAAVYPCAGGAAVADATSITLQQAASPTAPVVAVTGPTRIVPCNNVIRYDATVTSGAGNRPISDHAWSAPFAFHDHGNYITANTSDLDFASLGRFTVSVVVTNFAGQTGTASTVVEASTLVVPELQFTEAPTHGERADILSFRVRATNCPQSMFEFSHFVEPSGVTSVASSSDPTHIVVGPFSLIGNYTLHITATNAIDPSATATIRQNVTVTYRPLQLSLSSGSELSVSASARLEVEAVVADPDAVAETEVFSWSCVDDTGVVCRSGVTGQVVDVSSMVGSVFSLGAYTLAAGRVYTIGVTVHKGDRAARTFTRLSVSALTLPALAVEQLPMASLQCDWLFFARVTIQWPSAVPTATSVKHSWNVSFESNEGTVASSLLTWTKWSDYVSPLNSTGAAAAAAGSSAGAVVLTVRASALASAAAAGFTADAFVWKLALGISAPGYADASIVFDGPVVPREAFAVGSVQGERAAAFEASIATVPLVDWPVWAQTFQFFRVRDIAISASSSSVVVPNRLFVSDVASSVASSVAVDGVAVPGSDVAVGAGALFSASTASGDGLCVPSNPTVSLPSAQALKTKPNNDSNPIALTAGPSAFSTVNAVVAHLEMLSSVLAGETADQVVSLLRTSLSTVTSSSSRDALNLASGVVQAAMLLSRLAPSFLVPTLPSTGSPVVTEAVDLVFDTFELLVRPNTMSWYPGVWLDVVALSADSGSASPNPALRTTMLRFPASAPTSALTLPHDTGIAMVINTLSTALSTHLDVVLARIANGTPLLTDSVTTLPSDANALVSPVLALRHLDSPGLTATASVTFAVPLCLAACKPTCHILNSVAGNWTTLGVGSVELSSGSQRKVTCQLDVKGSQAVWVGVLSVPVGVDDVDSDTSTSKSVLDSGSPLSLGVVVVGLLLLVLAGFKLWKHRNLSEAGRKSIADDRDEDDLAPSERRARARPTNTMLP